MTTTYERILLTNSTAGAEHFGAISDSVTYRVMVSPYVDNDTAAVVRNELIGSSGYAGIIALPGRPLVVDNVVQFSNDMVVRTISCQTVQDGAGTDITIGLTRYDWGATGQPGDVPIRLSTTVTGQTVQVYRTSPKLPTGTTTANEFTDDEWVNNGNLQAASGSVPTADDPDDGTYRPKGDIGGQFMDWNGNPISVVLPAVSMTIEVLRRGAYFSPLNVVVPDDFKPHDAVQFVGKRNNIAFAGFDMGELLCTGIERKVLDGEWTSVVFKCDSHPYRHAYQVPRPTFMTTMGTNTYQGDPRSISHTRGVYWKQPYLESTDFSEFFTTDEASYITAATA